MSTNSKKKKNNPRTPVPASTLVATASSSVVVNVGPQSAATKTRPSGRTGTEMGAEKAPPPSAVADPTCIPPMESDTLAPAGHPFPWTTSWPPGSTDGRLSVRPGDGRVEVVVVGTVGPTVVGGGTVVATVVAGAVVAVVAVVVVVVVGRMGLVVVVVGLVATVVVVVVVVVGGAALIAPLALAELPRPPSTLVSVTVTEKPPDDVGVPEMLAELPVNEKLRPGSTLWDQLYPGLPPVATRAAW